MAAAFFNVHAERAGIGARAESAGIAPWEQGADYDTLEVAKELGVDLSGHRTRSLNLPMLHQYQWVLTMTETHKARLEQGYALASGLVYTLMEAIGSKGDIYDPDMKPMRVYRDCAAQLWAATGQLVKRMQQAEENGKPFVPGMGAGTPD
jgi:protein-tyrosine-phosphatase